MLPVWTYTIVSVLIVSLISLLGITALSLTAERLKQILIYLVSFSAGALFGDAFIHLLPEIVEETGWELSTSLATIGGILTFFILEKILHWHHYHLPHTHEQVHPFAVMNLIADGIHNFIDGLIIGASYLASIPVGIATTVAVSLHEIPQEIGDFGILLHGGFSTRKAVFYNFLSALMALFGALVALAVSSVVDNVTTYLIPFAAGGFIYIAGSDLIPELHKEAAIKKSLLQLVAFVLGILIMFLLLGLE